MPEKIIFLLKDYLLFAYSKYDIKKFQYIKKYLEIFIKNNIDFNFDSKKNINLNLQQLQTLWLFQFL